MPIFALPFLMGPAVLLIIPLMLIALPLLPVILLMNATGAPQLGLRLVEWVVETIGGMEQAEQLGSFFVWLIKTLGGN